MNRWVASVVLAAWAGQAAAVGQWSVTQSAGSNVYVLCEAGKDCPQRTQKTLDMEQPRPMPPTPAPAPVVSAPTKPEPITGSVAFSLGSSKLSALASKELDRLVMDAGRDKRFAIMGMTDKLGTRRFNRKLALDRAKSVQRYLVAKGVPASRISITTNCCAGFPPLNNPGARRAVITISDLETARHRDSR
jgi:outer membrane protein OmpA-like peptidoglycan-associated protein